MPLNSIMNLEPFIDESEKYLMHKKHVSDEKKFLSDATKSYNKQGFTNSEKVQKRFNSKERDNQEFVLNQFQKFLGILPDKHPVCFQFELDKYYFSRVSHFWPKHTFEKLPLETRFTICNVCFKSTNNKITHIISYQPTISGDSFIENVRLPPTSFSLIDQENDVTLFAFINGIGRWTFIIFQLDIGYLLPSMWVRLHENSHQAFRKLAKIIKNSHKHTKTIKEILCIDATVSNLKSFKTSDLYPC